MIWQLHGDAMRPTEAPWGFIARNPFQRVIPPNGKVKIDTGVAANVPMLAFARGDQADYTTVPLLIPAGVTVTAIVENKSAHSALVIDDREAIVNLHPLVFKGKAEVG